MPRFRIKRLKGTLGRYSSKPWKLTDRERPALILEFRSLDLALVKMDNIVRAERGFLPRRRITTAEVRAAMKSTEPMTIIPAETVEHAEPTA